VAAPILLTLLRMLQGLSVGGEYIGSIAFRAEHAPPNRRAFYGSWSGFTVVLGTLLGSAVAALATLALSDTQLHAWGWRVAFISGLAIGALGFWLRLGIAESPDFAELRRTGQLAANPIADALRRDRGAIITTIGLTGLSSVGFYLPFVWLPTWLSQMIAHPLPKEQAFASSTISLSALLVLIPLLALLSDRVGRRPMYLAASAGYALLSYPLMSMMSSGTFAAAIAGGLAFAVVSSLFGCCMGATMVELFPTQTRYTGVAIGYNVGQAVLSGTAPLVAVALVEHTHHEIAPAFYLIFCGVVAAFFSFSIPALHNKPLPAVHHRARRRPHPLFARGGAHRARRRARQLFASGRTRGAPRRLRERGPPRRQTHHQPTDRARDRERREPRNHQQQGSGRCRSREVRLPAVVPRAAALARGGNRFPAAARNPHR